MLSLCLIVSAGLIAAALVLAHQLLGAAPRWSPCC
jgi:hypothetical protein